MPFCEVRKTQEDSVDTELNHDPNNNNNNNGTKIFYRTYGHGPTKVLLIIGSTSFFLHFSFLGIWNFWWSIQFKICMYGNGLWLNFDGCFFGWWWIWMVRISWDPRVMGPTDQRYGGERFAQWRWNEERWRWRCLWLESNSRWQWEWRWHRGLCLW